MTDFDEENGEAERPSKSAIKREKRALFELGEAILELAENQRRELPMSTRLRDELAVAQRMKHSDARQRQLRYIAKLIAQENVEGIREQLDGFRERDRYFRQHFHRLEQLRDDLIQQGDRKLEELLDIYPQIDRQHIRQLLRQAQRELSRQKPPAAARKLFRYLREVIPQ